MDQTELSFSDAPPPPDGFGRIVHADARHHLQRLDSDSVDLSFFSPPYHVGKPYEENETFSDWQNLLQAVIAEHARIIKPGGFMVVNIGDILCFSDKSIPRFQADNQHKINPVTREKILAAKQDYPDANRSEIGKILGCSEQTVQRRLEHNNVRGGKQKPATKVLLTGCMIAEWAEAAGLYLYDQRIWHKDPAWTNSRWHSNSYRAVDEWEHIYVFWRPGIVTYDRDRISAQDWAAWGSRGVWHIHSVRRNKRHATEFPKKTCRSCDSLVFAVMGDGA